VRALAYRNEMTNPDGAPVLELLRPGASSEEIIEGLKASRPGAARSLYDEYEELINRLVWRTLGADPEHDDVVQQAFLNILTSIHKVENPALLRSWITSVTINTVRRELRSRKYRRILRLVPDVADDVDHQIPPTDRKLVRSAFAILRRMGIDDRMAFALHFIEGMTLSEVAGATDVSLATVKRRIARARRTFVSEVEKDTYLRSLVEEMQDDE
jgi:RNA polymerase sigma-70 factor (ECF subfamily)